MADRNTNNDAPEGWEHYAELLRGLPDRRPPAGHGARLDVRLSKLDAPRRVISRPLRYLLGAASLASIVLVVLFGLQRGDTVPKIEPVVQQPASTETAREPQQRARTRNSRPRLPEPTVSAPIDIYVDSTAPHLPDGGRGLYGPLYSGERAVTGMAARPANDRRPDALAAPTR